MLAEIYNEALLVDEDLADQVWDKGVIDDCVRPKTDFHAPIYWSI